MNTHDKILKLQELRDEIPSLLELDYNDAQIVEWKEDVQVALKKIFNDEEHLKCFNDSFKHSVTCASLYGDNFPMFQERYRKDMGKAQAKLNSMMKELTEWPDEDNAILASIDSLAIIANLCDKFHNVVKQLRQRHDGRTTLDVEDEYDVQDLFHALLTIYFDDIRPEEWTPSYAGGSSRMDFLLDNEGVVIELKMTRKSLGTKEAREQLIIDKEQYKVHPKCKHLICFVYDPEGRIKNPRGFEKDLSQTGEHLVTVYVRP